MASDGRLNEAVQRLSAAVKYNPNYAEALMALGDTLRRMGRFEASLKPYADVVRINPRAADARFGYAMALVRLRRYREARDWLDEGRSRAARSARAVATRWPGCWPRRRTTGAATGRGRWRSSQELMKGDEDDGDRRDPGDGDGGARSVPARQPTSSAGSWPRPVRPASTRDVRRMADNLRRYERGQACRVPWPDDDPAHIPADVRLGAAGQSDRPVRSNPT